MKKATTTTPDPELAVPLGTQPPEDILSGNNPRHEVTACPTGLADHPQFQPPQPPRDDALGTDDEGAESSS